jgi:hypothetical protein
MDLIYGKNYFIFKGKIHELNKFLNTLPSDLKVKDYLRLVFH